MDRNQVATSPGMGWRLKSESGGGMNRNRMATCVGIRTHPELTHYGTKIWSYFSQAQKVAEEYLDNLEERFDKQKNDNMVTKIREAKEYLLLIPERYKK